MRLDLNFLTLRFYVRLQLKNVFTSNMKLGGEIGGLQPFPIQMTKTLASMLDDRNNK